MRNYVQQEANTVSVRKIEKMLSLDSEAFLFVMHFETALQETQS